MLLEPASQATQPEVDKSTLALCYLGVTVEGFDLAAGGQIAGKVANFFSFSHSALGFSFGVNAAGLLVGAIAGGWLADRLGRKTVVIGCLALFGLLSLATAFTTDTATYLVARFLTGVGLGGSVPNLIAIAAEHGSRTRSVSRVTIISSGIPLGAAICAALTMMLPSDFDWRVIFVVGGVAPLLVAVLFLVRLPDKRHVSEQSHRSVRELFRQGRTPATLCIWVAFFLTMLTLALLVNWLPSLIVRNGHPERSAAFASAMFSLSGVAGGVLLGLAVDRMNRIVVFVTTYASVMIGLAVIAVSGGSFALGVLGSSITGFFLIGAQVLLFGLAPALYPTPIRATGVGFAVAAARSGSIAGPLLAGMVLQLSGTSVAVMAATLPCMAVALVALFPVLRAAFRPDGAQATPGLSTNGVNNLRLP